VVPASAVSEPVEQNLRRERDTAIELSFSNFIDDPDADTGAVIDARRVTARTAFLRAAAAISWQDGRAELVLSGRDGTTPFYRFGVEHRFGHFNPTTVRAFAKGHGLGPVDTYGFSVQQQLGDPSTRVGFSHERYRSGGSLSEVDFRHRFGAGDRHGMGLEARERSFADGSKQREYEIDFDFSVSQHTTVSLSTMKIPAVDIQRHRVGLSHAFGDGRGNISLHGSRDQSPRGNREALGLSVRWEF